MDVTEAVKYVQKQHNPQIKLLGYLISRFKRRRSYHQIYLRELREKFGDLPFDTVIPDLAPFEQSVTDRIPITLHFKRSRAADIARAFFDEVQQRIERHEEGGRTGCRANVRIGAASTVCRAA